MNLALAYKNRIITAFNRLEGFKDLFKNSVAMSFLEALTWSFYYVYTFKNFGVKGSLLFFAAQSVLIAFGYWGLFWVLYKVPLITKNSYRFCISSCFALTALVGTVSSNKAGVAVLLVATIFLGAAYAAQTWQELSKTGGIERESYLHLQSASAIVIQIVGMGVAGLLLILLDESLPIFFTITGILGAILSWKSGPIASQYVNSAPSPISVIFSKKYWDKAYFFIIEAAAGGLRAVLEITGAMAIIEKASQFGIVGSLGAILSFFMISWLAGHPSKVNPFYRLRAGLAGMFISWACLALALYWPMFFILYLFLSALSGPLIRVSYASLVLASMESSLFSLQSNAVARELLLLISRAAAMGLTLLLTSLVTGTKAILLVAISLVLVSIPLEYVLAKKMAKAQE